MVVEFRVLAVSKEKGSYETDMIKGLFLSDHPMLDAVDHLPVTSAMNIIFESNWKPLRSEVYNTNTHILVPYSGHIFE